MSHRKKTISNLYSKRHGIYNYYISDKVEGRKHNLSYYCNSVLLKYFWTDSLTFDKLILEAEVTELAVTNYSLNNDERRIFTINSSGEKITDRVRYLG